ncbi:DUF1543 domain-containing protein [Acinetobacter tianfuensis]|uniref:DUF1543 domain-containing protein n=1 Tax=Acinetobacter tianfuensis TaxID=2419603 RepID=A0A3A8ER61_9GAMM|nr:DUF1543 domain-containing protein [Acinetobacter tianfuensis]RKG32464.1 DUF1543 domain-containing protein [Acinetobacter tianfuensis]
MSNLYMVMLGGRHAKANTEVHDVVFAAGESLEDCYPQLREAWFGEQNGLHIDAWMKVTAAYTAQDAYQVILSQEPRTSALKLWLINLGGYDVREFGELHRYVLVAAAAENQAKQLGKAHFASHWQKQHTDRVLDVDDCIAVDQIAGHFIQLRQGPAETEQWENCYIRIDV